MSHDRKPCIGVSNENTVLPMFYLTPESAPGVNPARHIQAIDFIGYRFVDLLYNYCSVSYAT